MLNFDNLLSQAKRIKHELRVIGLVISILFQVIMITTKVVQIFMNPGHLVRVILYSIAMALTTLAIVFDTILFFNKSKKLKRVYKGTIKIITGIVKYVVNSVLVVLSFYENVTGNASFLSWSMAIVSAALLVISILFNMVTALVSGYINHIVIAFKMDCESNLIGSILKQYGKEVTNEETRKLESKVRQEIEEETSKYVDAKPVEEKIKKPNFIKAAIGAVLDASKKNKERKKKDVQSDKKDN